MSAAMESRRPAIHAVGSGAELKDWYWLKSELIEECRRRSLPLSGPKAELTDRLAHFLDNGSVLRPARRRSASRFDWHAAQLAPDTVITDNYRNTQNVRRFFKTHYGEDFRFNIAFMQWMKANVGKTLGEAVEARKAIAARERSVKPPIPANNQYNAYTRAFHAANPGRPARDARRCWAWKRSRPGHNRYEDSDLAALEIETGADAT